MLQKIQIDQLTTGMYVVEVTRQTGDVKITSAGYLKSDALLHALKAK